MQPQIISKLPKVGTTIFTEMSQLAQQYNAINLSQGFPDFDGDKKLFELVDYAMHNGMNQYAPMIGLLALREALSQKYYDIYKVNYHPDNEITITAGGSEAIFSTISALIHKGDEVVIFEPAYDLYRPVIELNGGLVTAIKLSPPNFKIDWNEVKALINDRTRMIIINNPNNPTTNLFTLEDLEELEKIVQHTNILILSDEVYEHIVYNQLAFHSICTFENLKNRSVIVASFGKLLHVTGWKIGYCLAPNFIMKEIRKVHQYNTFSVHTPSQYAISKGLCNTSIYHELSNYFQEKRDYFSNGLMQSKFKPLECKGTYFMLVDYSNLSDENDIEYAKSLIQQGGVASIPIGAFYSDVVASKLLRFCFAKNKETLDRALEKLIKL